MYKKKIFWQMLICMFLSVIYVSGGNFSNPKISEAYDKAVAYIEKPVSVTEVQNYIQCATDSIKKAPRTAVDVIAKANTSSMYGEPIDEETSIPVKHVHAVCGGKVTKVGKSSIYGLYIEIKHKNATSVYGNLYDINVFEDERVSRGEIIGSYDSDSDKDFYFELNENF